MPEARSAIGGRVGGLRAVALLVIALVVVFATSFAVLNWAGLADAAWYRARLAQLDAREVPDSVVATLVVLALIADLALPVPASVVMTLAGVRFGTVVGAALNVVGAFSGAQLGYALCRRYGSRAFVRLVGPAELPRVVRVFDRFGPWAIVLSRSLPMLTETASCLAGLHRMPARQFAALTLLGTVPVSAGYAWAGANIGVEFGFGLGFLLALAVPAVGLAIARALSH